MFTKKYTWKKRFLGKVFISVIIALQINFLLGMSAIFSPSYAVNNLKYFGYYWGMNTYPSVKGSVNAMFIQNEFVMTSLDDLIARDKTQLNTLSADGAKGIVDVTGVFFYWDNTAKRFFLYTGPKGSLNDWEYRWNYYWQQMYSYLPKILAFYPMDEPNIRIFSDGGMTANQIFALITHLIKINVDSAKVDYPGLNIPVMTTISAAGVGSYTIPPDVDWLGFDEYPCNETGCGNWSTITSKFTQIVNTMSATGKYVFIVPQGYYKFANATPQQQQLLIDHNTAYYQLCSSTPKCVGMFNFLLPQSNGDEVMYGVSTMPALLSYMNSLGKQILGIVPTPTPIPTSIPTQITRIVTEDSYVDNGSPTTNYGTADTIRIKDKGVGFTRESYLKFDISSVNTINTAVLKLYGKINESAEPATVTGNVTVTKLNPQSWNESTITWNTKPTIPSTDYLTSFTVSGNATNQWYNVDVTNYLKAQKQAGATRVSFGLIQEMNDQGYLVAFKSKETTTQPTLVLTVSQATPTPTATKTPTPIPTRTPTPLPTATPIPLPTATPIPRVLSTNKPATASNYDLSQNALPSLAFDTTPGTAWNAGGYPTQWIMVDLQTPSTITNLSLVPAQVPSTSNVIKNHNIWIAGENMIFSKVATINQITTSGQTIAVNLGTPRLNVRYIKVETTASDSWVAWFDIKVYGY